MDDTTANLTNSERPEFIPADFGISAMGQPGNLEKSPGNEVEKECPLCKSVIRYFFVNFNEKVLLCDNQDCEYPFGYEDLEFVKQDDQWDSNDELESITTIMSRPTQAGSIISTHAWSDIDKLNKAYDSEDSQQELPIKELESKEEKELKLQEYLRAKEAELQTKRNIQQIKKLNNQLQKTYDEDNFSCITNEKWIKHLMVLQGLSGVPLLKKQEIARLRRDEAELGSNELTIGINSGQSESSITIEILNRDTSKSEAA
ncbi:uncharacterized protein [Choristoneura fumiferana]|uniref:uncharacterized protein n=1 Tax=Choristoneura fumiferana TaxID=7141 RepID=UPI003D15B3C4